MFLLVKMEESEMSKVTSFLKKLFNTCVDHIFSSIFSLLRVKDIYFYWFANVHLRFDLVSNLLVEGEGRGWGRVVTGTLSKLVKVEFYCSCYKNKQLFT